MSKKNLSRTVIEGGRGSGSKWDRHQSHVEDRAEAKNYIQDVSHDIENWYDYDKEPMRKAYKGFNDKLGPLYRWLKAQVGRPWDDVYSQVCGMFDTRTTAGRHIVFDHLLYSVETEPNYSDWNYRYSNLEDRTMSYSKHAFYVDESGILQQKTYISRRTKIPQFNTQSIANWMNGRIVGKVGKKLFWFVPATKSKKYFGYSHEWKTEWKYEAPYDYWNRGGLRFLYLGYDPISSKDKDGNKIIKEYQPVWKQAHRIPNLRQDRKLSDEDLKFWESIPEYYQNKVLDHSPTNPNPPVRKYY